MRYPFIIRHDEGLPRIGFEHWAVNLKHRMLILGRLTLAWQKGPWWQYSTPAGRVWSWAWSCPVYRVGGRWRFDPPWQSNGCSQWGLRITSRGWGPDGKPGTIVHYPPQPLPAVLTPEQERHQAEFVAKVLAEHAEERRKENHGDCFSGVNEATT